MTYHIVRTNETIEKIASAYNLEFDEIKEENKFIKDWSHLIPGTKLKLPEISRAMNEEINNEEPFIEDYYPKLKDFNNYHLEEEIKEEIKEDKEVEQITKKEEAKEENEKKDEKKNLNMIYGYPYYYPYYLSSNPYYPYYRVYSNNIRSAYYIKQRNIK